MLDGNPADVTLAVQAIQRHDGIFGALPRRVAFDDGFASRANLVSLKACVWSSVIAANLLTMARHVLT